MIPATISQILDQNGKPTQIFNSAYITTQTTILVKSGNTFLHSITFNKPVATGTCEIDNAITQTNPVGIITTPANPQPVTLFYDIYLATGLSITTGTANQDITVSYL
jgi:hypothetical protein